MILADKITDLRKKNGWSQEELAGKLGVSRQSVSKWENGIVDPSTSNLLALAKLYGISAEALLQNITHGQSGAQHPSDPEEGSAHGD